jgi:peptidoglycan/LPS O-acetylase OafA/YrhL
MIDEAKSRNNNFGLLRVVLATLVIISHSPEILDGNRSRELLTRFFGTLSFGDVAVDGFFLISGYLVTKSFVSDPSIASYLEKRILRIYPGFLVSFWICVLLVEPFVSGPGKILSFHLLLGQLSNSLTLQRPLSAGVFSGLGFADLNNSMWTISFEFNCYIGAMCLGMMGLYSRRLRAGTSVLVALLLLANAFDPLPHGFPLNSIVRFGAIFGTGALFYLYHLDKLRFTGRGAFLCALMLCALLFSRRWAEAALAVFGGYLIFWSAFEVPVLPLSKAANKTDLSYGIYLYAWPIASVIAWRFRHINPWLLSIATLVCSASIAFLSWTFVEEPCLKASSARRHHIRTGVDDLDPVPGAQTGSSPEEPATSETA